MTSKADKLKKRIGRPPLAAAMVCPEGHGLPNYTKRGQCTMVWCALEPLDAKRKKKQKRGDDSAMIRGAIENQLNASQVELDLQAKSDKRTAIAIVQGHLQSRHAMVRYPKGEEAKDPEAWADKRIPELLIDAVAEIEWRLLYGDDEQRNEAAMAVLNATGRGKREALQAGANTLVLNLAPGQTLPWARPTGQIDVVPTTGSVATPMLQVETGTKNADEQPGEAQEGPKETVQQGGAGPGGVDAAAGGGSPAA